MDWLFIIYLIGVVCHYIWFSYEFLYNTEQEWKKKYLFPEVFNLVYVTILWPFIYFGFLLLFLYSFGKVLLLSYRNTTR